MNGNRYLLDTNAIIQLLTGNPEIAAILKNAEYIACSVVSVIEFLAFNNLADEDRTLFQAFLEKIDVIDLISSDSALIDQIVRARNETRVKLPDAIVYASAISNSSRLVTADQKVSSQ